MPNPRRRTPPQEVIPTVGEAWQQPSLALDETPLADVTFCVIDLETTGMGDTSAITEIGAVKVRGGEQLGSFQTLVNPGEHIPAFISRLTGITNAMVRDAPPLEAIFPSLIEFARGSVMVAHNAGFDMGFILRAAKDLGYEWPSPIVLDTLRVARHVLPKRDVGNYQLSTLAQYFHVDHDPSHRALDDVLATVDVLHALIERVGNQGVTTLEDLQAYTHTVSKQRRHKARWAGALPEGPGVYFFVRDAERGREVLYVGTSKNLRRRVKTYFTAAETRGRMEEMVALATGVETVPCHTSLEAAVVELRLIFAHQPPYNRRSKAPRHTWLTITDEPIPRISIVRHPGLAGQPACGPFPGREPADQAAHALMDAFPLRPCTYRLSTRTPREPCALAQMGSCSAPCTLNGVEPYRQMVETARSTLGTDVTPVRETVLSRIDALASDLRFEEAGEALERLRAYERGTLRGARLAGITGCPLIAAACRVHDLWEVHLFSYGQLVGAGVARAGEDPVALAEVLARCAKTVPDPDLLEPGRIEEIELCAAWLERPGVRLLDVDGVWGWPLHAG